MAVNALPDLGDRELAGRALQQAHAEVGFKLGDATAQARFRDAERALGTEATQALERSINGSSKIMVAFRGTDRYGRRLARLTLDGTDVADPLIAAGLARPYEGGRRDGWCG